jgi:hypothetical protein
MSTKQTPSFIVRALAVLKIALRDAIAELQNEMAGW